MDAPLWRLSCPRVPCQPFLRSALPVSLKCCSSLLYVGFHSSCSLYVCNLFLLECVRSQSCPLTNPYRLISLSPALVWVLSVVHFFSCVGNKPKDLIQGQKAAEARPPTQSHCLFLLSFLTSFHLLSTKQQAPGPHWVMVTYKGSTLRQTSHSRPAPCRMMPS